MDSFAKTPDTITDDEGKKYKIVKKSADKYIGQGINDPTMGIAVARNESKNESTENEFHTLEWLADETSVIPVYRLFTIPNPENPSKTCAAFTMKWINGLHSKSDKPDFERALANQKNNETTKQDLASITKYITQKATIPDLQVMLETATGRLMIIDPRGVEMQGNPDHPFIKRWMGLLAGTIQPTTAETYNKDD